MYFANIFSKYVYTFYLNNNFINNKKLNLRSKIYF